MKFDLNLSLLALFRILKSEQLFLQESKISPTSLFSLRTGEVTY